MNKLAQLIWMSFGGCFEVCTFPRARASPPPPLCFFVRASASTQAAKLFALWPLPLFRPLGPSILDFRTFCPLVPLSADSPHKITTISSARPFIYFGSGGRYVRQASLKAGTPQPGSQKATKGRLPPSRWPRSSPLALAHSLFARSEDAVEE